MEEKIFNYLVNRTYANKLVLYIDDNHYLCQWDGIKWNYEQIDFEVFECI